MYLVLLKRRADSAKIRLEDVTFLKQRLTTDNHEQVKPWVKIFKQSQYMTETVVPETYPSDPVNMESRAIEVSCQGHMIEIAAETKQPNRLQIGGEVIWFDRQGDKARKGDAERFEGMLTDGTVKEIDKLEPKIKTNVEARIRQLIYLIEKPVKFNGTWWDVDAIRVRSEDADRFEKKYNNRDV